MSKMLASNDGDYGIYEDDFYKWAAEHYDAEYYRVLNGTNEILTYEELCMRLISEGSDEWWVNQDIDEAIDEGLYETVKTEEAKPIWEAQGKRMRRCASCAYLEGGECWAWVCGLDGKNVLAIEHCECVERPSLLSTVYTEDDLKEMGK